METALNEIALVLFTTIAPAGAIGYLIMAWDVLRTPDKQRADAVSRYLVVPLVLTISGLIASATHLGTPANALYVITGIGRSPLSNEVVAAVAFLALGGVYWIVSFRDDLPRLVRNVWLGLVMAAGAVFVTFIALAYSVPSVPTWNLPTVPVTLWLGALSSGPFVGLFGIALAKQALDRQFVRGSLIVAVAATVANALVLAGEWNALASVITTTTRAVDLVPLFPWVIAGYAALHAAALALVLVKRKVPAKFLPALLAVAAALTLAACFAVRFTFYAMHMTVGI